jgi:hypothetical protein
VIPPRTLHDLSIPRVLRSPQRITSDVPSLRYPIRAAYWGPSYYAAFVIDPDGHPIEAVCQREDEANHALPPKRRHALTAESLAVGSVLPPLSRSPFESLSLEQSFRTGQP